MYESNQYNNNNNFDVLSIIKNVNINDNNNDNNKHAKVFFCYYCCHQRKFSNRVDIFFLFINLFHSNSNL